MTAAASNQARKEALEWLDQRGFKAERPVLGKFDENPNKGKPIGFSTADGKTGYRIEFDKRSGAHINVWSGKEKGPHIKFKATERSVNKIIRNLKC